MSLRQRLNSERAIEWARRALRATDEVALQAYQVRRYVPRRVLGWESLGAGAMTAILRRMGQRSFHEYAAAQMLGHFGRRTFLPIDRESMVARLRIEYPEQLTDTLTTADELVQGTFDLLGSGPVDMRRGERGEGWRIDWRLDPRSGQRFPRMVDHWCWSQVKRPGADIKAPWEIGRCQHFATLGMAWWLTGEARFAECFARTVRDFRRQNPVGMGVQWACPMDVGLRLVSWLIGVSFFQGAPQLNFSWWRGFLRGLVEHGQFIAEHLEYGTYHSEIITSNHHLSNLVGLYWLALAFPHLDAGCVWRGLAQRGLEDEIDRQILADGSNYESSVPYHRLDLELFLSAYAMSVQHQAPLPAAYRERLSSGLRFLAGLRQPSGRMPQVGDADNGRAHVLTEFGRWNQESMDHLLAAGAKVLGEPELAADVPHEARFEALWWGEGIKAPVVGERVSKEGIFPEAGYALARRGASYALLTNSVVGTSGFGNHKHNDQLAIEWVVGEQPIVVDGGSYIYTPDPDARNSFRSVRTHNTVCVDDEEQNTINPQWLFRLMSEGERTLERIEDGSGAVGLRGDHTCYARLAAGLKHSRRVLLDADGSLLVDDWFEGSTDRRLRWYLLLYPAIRTQLVPGGIELSGPLGSGRLATEPGMTWNVIEGWYSPGYGRRLATRALVAERRDGPSRVSFGLVPAGLTNWSWDESISRADAFWGRRERTRRAA
jgi:hypothetical protein